MKDVLHLQVLVWWSTLGAGVADPDSTLGQAGSGFDSKPRYGSGFNFDDFDPDTSPSSSMSAVHGFADPNPTLGFG